MVSSGAMRNSVRGPRGSPKTVVSACGRLRQLTMAKRPDGFKASCTERTSRGWSGTP
jgi:hypothetical protein